MSQDLYRRKVVDQVTDHSQMQYTVNILDTVGKEEAQQSDQGPGDQQQVLNGTMKRSTTHGTEQVEKKCWRDLSTAL